MILVCWKKSLFWRVDLASFIQNMYIFIVVPCSSSGKTVKPHKTTTPAPSPPVLAGHSSLECLTGEQEGTTRRHLAMPKV